VRLSEVGGGGVGSWKLQVAWVVRAGEGMVLCWVPLPVLPGSWAAAAVSALVARGLEAVVLWRTSL